MSKLLTMLVVLNLDLDLEGAGLNLIWAHYALYSLHVYAL